MSIQEFTDGGGVRWRVWATTPVRGNVRPQFAAGWLAFESGHERRRLAPIPPGWPQADDAALRGMLARAVVVVHHSASPPAPLPTRGEEASAGDTRMLHVTVARVRAVLHEVEETLRRE